MITLYYEGYNNKAERKIIESAALFASNKLFPRHKVSVTIILVNNLHKKENIQGDVIYEDCGSRPRDFTIRLHKGMDEAELATLIFHEFVHIKQYIRKELVLKYDSKLAEYKIYFKGKDVSNIKYWDLPYEKEAYKLQEKLYKQYLNSINL